MTVGYFSSFLASTKVCEVMCINVTCECCHIINVTILNLYAYFSGCSAVSYCSKHRCLFLTFLRTASKCEFGCIWKSTVNVRNVELKKMIPSTFSRTIADSRSSPVCVFVCSTFTLCVCVCVEPRSHELTLHHVSEWKCCQQTQGCQKHVLYW